LLIRLALWCLAFPRFLRCLGIRGLKLDGESPPSRVGNQRTVSLRGRPPSRPFARELAALRSLVRRPTSAAAVSHSLSRFQSFSPRRCRFGKVHDAIEPVPSMTLISPELCQQSRLVTVVGAANGTAEEHQSAVVLAGTEHLPRMPGKRRPVERDQHQSGLGARRQQCSVIETKPRPLPPVGNVDNGKRVAEAPAG